MMRIGLPLRRWSSNLLYGLSLLIFLLAMGIWVRSYFREETLIRTSAEPGPPKDVRAGHTVILQCLCTRGTLCLNHLRIRRRNEPSIGNWNHGYGPPTDISPEPRSPEDRINLHLAGFQFRSGNYSRGGTPVSDTLLLLPLWLFGVFAIPPVLWVRRWRRRGVRGFPVQLDPSAPTPALPRNTGGGKEDARAIALGESSVRSVGNAHPARLRYNPSNVRRTRI